MPSYVVVPAPGFCVVHRLSYTQCVHCCSRSVRVQANDSSSSGGMSRVADTESDEDLEKAMEEFLRKQQEKESGEQRRYNPGTGRSITCIMPDQSAVRQEAC